MLGMRMQLSSELSFSLSLAHQKRLGRTWDGIVSDDLAFVPTEELENREVTVRECLENNQTLGNFATRHLKQAFTLNQRRKEDKKKVVAVGYGRGYDSDWLVDAIIAYLQTWWVDVSHIACGFAAAGMLNQLQKLPHEHHGYPLPQVKQAEIRSMLANPATVGLDLESVEIWYLCRVLSCLSERSAKIVLQLLGRSLSEECDPDKKNAIVYVGALKGENPKAVGKRSRLPTDKWLFRHISIGAKRPVYAPLRETCPYFQKTVTAMTIQAF